MGIERKKEDKRLHRLTDVCCLFRCRFPAEIERFATIPLKNTLFKKNFFECKNGNTTQSRAVFVPFLKISSKNI